MSMQPFAPLMIILHVLSSIPRPLPSNVKPDGYNLYQELAKSPKSALPCYEVSIPMTKTLVKKSPRLGSVA